jgi:hypothetical protein
MVGGQIIQIKEVNPGIFELWCVDGYDECAVRVKNPERLPKLGSGIWWQSGKVYCENDTLVLNKFSNSYTPSKEREDG